MSYIDHLKYKEMADDLDYYLKNVKVVSFDIIQVTSEKAATKIIKQSEMRTLITIQKKNKIFLASCLYK